MTKIEIGTFTCDKRFLDKSSYIKDMQVYNCEIYESCNVMYPIFILRYDSRIFNCNYAYVSEWNRYYYIADIRLNPAGKMIITCREDVLMSNKNAIKNLDVNVIRNQKQRNKLLVDYEYPAEIMSTLTTLKFNRTPFNNNGDDYTIIMGVIGGKANDN